MEDIELEFQSGSDKCDTIILLQDNRLSFADSLAVHKGPVGGGILQCEGGGLCVVENGRVS